MKIKKCSNCYHKINVQERVNINDYTTLNSNTILIYCPICGNSEVIKIDDLSEMVKEVSKAK